MPRPEDGKIFISYRRSDAQGVAGRLNDSLGAYFGHDRVFRDIEDIAGGADFGDIIHGNLGSADALVVLIGPEWASTTDGDGQRRLMDPDDWVAAEIGAALDSGTPVFPVLIEDTPMPRPEDLPPRLQPLLRRNAVTITDLRWHHDVTRLAKIVAPQVDPAKRKWHVTGAGVGLAGAFVGLVAYWLFERTWETPMLFLISNVTLVTVLAFAVLSGFKPK